MRKLKTNSKSTSKKTGNSKNGRYSIGRIVKKKIEKDVSFTTKTSKKVIF